MDYLFAKAYMAERRQDADRLRLLAQLRLRDPRPSPLDQLRRLITEQRPLLRPTPATRAVTSSDCVELDCCAA